MIKQIQPGRSHVLMAPLLPLLLAMTGLITPSKLLADNHGEWVTAPDVKPGYILLGVNAENLTHHQIKIKKRKGSRVKIEWIMTKFAKKPWVVMTFENQFECKKNKSRFRLLSEDKWRDWEPVKEGTYTDSAKEKACKIFPD